MKAGSQGFRKERRMTTLASASITSGYFFEVAWLIQHSHSRYRESRGKSFTNSSYDRILFARDNNYVLKEGEQVVMSIELPEAQILAEQMDKELRGKQIRSYGLFEYQKMQKIGFINKNLKDFDLLLNVRIESVTSR